MISSLFVVISLKILYNVRCLQISTSSYEGMPLAVMEGLVNGNILLMSTIPSHIELVNGFPLRIYLTYMTHFLFLVHSLIMLDSSTLDQLSIASSGHYKPVYLADFLQSWSRVYLILIQCVVFFRPFTDSSILR